MIKAAIIDIDDTFSLTEATSFKIENNILRRMGQPPMSRKIHLETWEQPLAKALPIRSPGTDLQAFTAAYLPIIEEYTKSGKIEKIPAANYKALDRLIQLHKMLFVLTSRTHERIVYMLDPDHSLGSRIKTFYYRDNLAFHKPNPRVFDGLLKDNALRAQECVYIGDSLHDAKAAKDAGLHFIACLESGLRRQESFTGVPVDIFIDTFPDVVAAVQSLDAKNVST